MMDGVEIEEMSIRAVQEKMDEAFRKRWTKRSVLRCREQSGRAKNTPRRLSRRSRVLETLGLYCLR